MRALQAAARSPPPAVQRSLDVGLTTRRGGGQAAATSQGQASDTLADYRKLLDGDDDDDDPHDHDHDFHGCTSEGKSGCTSE